MLSITSLNHLKFLLLHSVFFYVMRFLFAFSVICLYFSRFLFLIYPQSIRCIRYIFDWTQIVIYFPRLPPPSNFSGFRFIARTRLGSQVYRSFRLEFPIAYGITP